MLAHHCTLGSGRQITSKSSAEYAPVFVFLYLLVCFLRLSQSFNLISIYYLSILLSQVFPSTPLLPLASPLLLLLLTLECLLPQSTSLPTLWTLQYMHHFSYPLGRNLRTVLHDESQCHTFLVKHLTLQMPPYKLPKNPPATMETLTPLIIPSHTFNLSLLQCIKAFFHIKKKKKKRFHL